MQKLSAKEKAMMDAIENSLLTRGYAPSVRELCEILGYHSTSTVQMYLDRLESCGYIRREGGKSRSISLCRETASVRQIPLLRDDAPQDAPLCAELVESTLSFCYCGELPEGAEIFARRLSDASEIAVIIRQKADASLRTIAVLKLL